MLHSAQAALVKVAASAIPFIIAPTGTMANNGAITLGTALPTTYANAYIFLPANAIATGSTAGWYFCQMSSTTVGTVFNNTYSTGQPSTPASPTAFATTGPGAYTGVTSATIGPQITVPAGTLGPNGILRISDQWSCTNSAGSKTLAAGFSGTNVKSFSLTTSNGYREINTLYNRGAQNSQVGDQFGLTTGGSGITTGTNQFYTINFAAAQTFTMTGTLAVATDFIVMESFLLEAIPG